VQQGLARKTLSKMRSGVSWTTYLHPNKIPLLTYFYKKEFQKDDGFFFTRFAGLHGYTLLEERIPHSDPFGVAESRRGMRGRWHRHFE
jgi:hypothetical protein